MTMLPITRSFVDADALAERLAQEYELSDVRCQLISATLRDVYLVLTPHDRFVFYLYRAGARTLEQIAAEWRFVAFLAAHGVPVVPAVPIADDSVVLSCSLPEGVRYGVLTTFVAGRLLRQQATEEAAATFGRHVATIHTLADRFGEPLDRPANDIAAIIDEASSAE